MNKICCSLEQSKKLVELGIDVDTADMRYGYIAPYEYSDRMYDGGYDDVPYPKDFLKKNPNFSENDYDGEFPAWSLSALLGLMPKHIKQNDGRIYKFHIFNDDGIVIQRWGCSYCAEDFHNRAEYLSDPHLTYPTNVYSDKYEDPIDAAFEMVCWLKENGKI